MSSKELPKGYAIKIDSQPPREFADPRRPDSCSYRDPNKIINFINTIPLTLGGTLSDQLFEIYGKQQLQTMAKTRFPRIIAHSLERFIDDLRFAAKQEELPKIDGKGVPNLWTLYPNAKPVTAQMRISAITFEPPRIGRVYNVDNAVASLHPLDRDMIERRGMPLPMAITATHPFTITEYIQTYPRKTDLQGTISCIVVGALIRMKHMNRFETRFYTHMQREFAKTSGMDLKITAKEREFQLLIQHAETVNQAAHPISSGWGIGKRR